MIVCTFEKDFCHWENLEDAGSQYAWIRNNTNGLTAGGLSAPEMGDHQSNKDRFYVIASDMKPENQAQGATANLLSPYLKSNEHPRECFGFWVYLSDLNQGDYLQVFVRFSDQEEPVLYWSLEAAASNDGNAWIKGSFEIKAENAEIEYQVQFQAVRGSNSQGFIALDDLDFLGTPLCEFRPEQAKPTTTSVSTTPSTTPAPTEPPNRKTL